MQKLFSKVLPFSLLLLFVLLPLHALVITSLTHFFFEEGSPPPFFLKTWKEMLLFFLFVSIGLLVFFQIKPLLQKKGIWEGIRNFWKNSDMLDICILLFSFLAIGISFFSGFLDPEKFSLTLFIYGIKYTLLPLWILFVFRRIPPEISQKFLDFFQRKFPDLLFLLLGIGLIFFIGAQKFPDIFVFLGYSTDHSFYSIFQPLAYCQQISFTELCRAQGTFSGPNQFGAYLIFAFLFSVAGFFSTSFSSSKKSKNFFLLLSVLSAVLLFLTFSRSAWIGGFFGLIFLLIFFPEKNISASLKKKIMVGLITIPFIFSAGVFAFFPEISEKIIHRDSSSSQHYELSVQGVQYVQNNPLGSGLGSAGAASKYTSEKGQKEAGFVPENWYLQIGIETGVLGIFLWLGIIFFVMKKLVQKNGETLEKNGETLEKNLETRCTVSLQNISKINFPIGLAAAIFGISIMGLFLHSWESSAVAYSVFGLAGIMLCKKKER